MFWLFLFSGSLWKDHSNDGVRRILADNEIPLDKLMLETDSPFMFPAVDRGKFSPEVLEQITPQSRHVLSYCNPGRNEPCSMPMVVELVAACMGKPSNLIADVATRNALNFFLIPE